MLSDPHLVAFHEVVQAVARQTDLRQTLALIAEKARSITSASTASVMLLDDSRTLLNFTAVAGPDAAQMVGQTVFVSDSLAGHTALTGEIYLLHNSAESQPLVGALDPELTLGLGVRSAAVLPIYISGRPTGALAVINREDHAAFGGEDVIRLQLMANTTALAVGVDNLRKDVAFKRRERDILYDAARTISSSLSVQDVMRNVLAIVSENLEITTGVVYLMNDERTRLYIGADIGLSDDDRERQLAADDGIVAEVITSGSPRWIDDIIRDEFVGDSPLTDCRSLLMAPMNVRSTTEGIIAVGSRQAGAYRKQDADLLLAVASQAAVALENARLYEDTYRRGQEAAAIYELSQTIGATLQLDRVLNFVADSVLSLLEVDKFALFLYNSKRDCLEIKVTRNLTRSTVESMCPRLGEGIAGWVLEFETPTAVQDVSADHRNKSCPIDGEDVTSLVCVPLQSGDQVIGVVQAMSSRRRLFTVGEMELLYTIANQVGAAISNAQMYEEARQKSEEIRKYVRRVALALASPLNPQDNAQVITDLAVEITGADRAVLYAVREDGVIKPQAATNIKTPLDLLVDENVALTPLAWVARRGRSLVIENLPTDTRFSSPGFVVRDRGVGYLGLPLKLGKDVHGVLEVYSRMPRRFTPDEVRLMITFASQASIGMQNAALVEKANRRLADLHLIQSLSEILYSDCSVEELCRQTVDAVCKATQSQAGLVQLFNGPDNQALYREGTLGENSSGSGDEIGAILGELAEWVRTYKLFAQLPSPEISSEGVFALAVPIPVNSKKPPIGALLVYRTLPHAAYDMYDRQLLDTVSNLLACRLR